MTAKISKWGNSQGLRMPKDIMESLHLHVGDHLNITIIDGKVILEPIKKDIPFPRKILNPDIEQVNSSSFKVFR